MKLTVSRWHFTKNSRSKTPALLFALGIPFREGKDFWSDNAHILPELYDELQSAAREKFHELHPDKGGDADEFREFIDAYKTACQRFRFYGVKPKAQELAQIPTERKARRRWMAARAARLRRKGNEQYKAYRREYYHRRKAAGWVPDKEKERKKRHRYQERHKDELALQQYKYRQANPEKVRRWRQNYKASCKRRGVHYFKKHDAKARRVPGTPEYERRKQWRLDNYQENKERINARRRVRNPLPKIRDHKGRYLPRQLEAAA